MKKYLQYLITVGLLALHAVSAQTKTGTTIGQFLLIEPSAKISSMGNAGVTQFGEAMAAYYNPAALGHMNGSGAQFTHNTWFAGITLDYFTAALRITDVSSLSLSISSLSSGEIAVRTVEQPLGTGEQYTVSDYSIGIGYGQKITDRFSAGIQLSYVQETIWHSNMSVFAFNFGTLYQISDDGLQLGASLSNFGMRGRYNGRDLRIRYDFDPTRSGDNSSLPAELITEEFSLPVVFRVGFGLPLKIDESNQFHFSIDAFHPSDNSESISLGGEYMFLNTFALRAGYQHLFQQDSEVGLTFGGGIEWDIANYIIRIDYSWNQHQRLGDTQRMTVGLAF